jgi:beta-lactamase superfamily II metal-dependent hydrolase
MTMKNTVSVRMYRQGLGDCFLLTFPGVVKPFHMLIDCGAIKSKHYDSTRMADVVRDIAKHTNNHLDVIAATHEHWDHISGFADAKAEFDAIDVDNVWVAWTEEPNNKAAKALKDEFKKGITAVKAALDRLPDSAKRNDQLGLYRKALEEVLGFYGGLGAAATTSDAWKYVLGKAPNVYCDPKKSPRELPGVEGVRVYVLGPPDDPAYVRKRLSKVETYEGAHPSFAAFASFVAAVGGAGDEAKAQALPFESRYRVAPKDAKRDPFFKTRYGFDDAGADAWRRIDGDWLNLAGELALHLDSFTNNTCLAIAIELVESGQVLLFPGDAQVGNWLSWGDLEWSVKDPDGTKRIVKVEDLLARTVLYKVGHHGSHNATLRAKGLERMESADLVAMIPVHRKTAKDQDWKFPYPPLWKRLKEKARGRVLLADAPDITELQPDAEAALSPAEFKRFETATRFRKLYVEYNVDY